MPFVERTGVPVHFTDSLDDGRTTAPTGLPLIMVHGLLMNARVWEPISPLLVDDHRVIAVDLRGHGESGTGTSNRVSDAVGDLIAVIEHLGLEAPMIVGSSIGAVIALEAARRHPASVSNVVAIGCIAHGTAAPGPFADGMRGLLDGMRTSFARTVEAAVPSWLGPLGGPTTTAWLLAIARGTDPAAAHALAADTLGWDPRTYLAEIDVPITFVHGGYDAIPREFPAQAATSSDIVRLLDVPEAGHMPHVETPGVIAAVVSGVHFQP